MNSLHLSLFIVIPCITLFLLILLCKYVCKIKKDGTNTSTTALHPTRITLPRAPIRTQIPNVIYSNRRAQNVADTPNSSNSTEPEYVRFSFSTMLENESLRTLSDTRTGSMLVSHSLSGHQTSNYPRGMYEMTSSSVSSMQYPGVRSSDMEDKPPMYSDVIKQDLGDKTFPIVSTKPPESPPPNYKERNF